MYLNVDIRPANITTKPFFENVNCKLYHEEIPKAGKVKRIPTSKQYEGARVLARILCKRMLTIEGLGVKFEQLAQSCIWHIVIVYMARVGSVVYCYQ